MCSFTCRRCGAVVQVDGEKTTRRVCDDCQRDHQRRYGKAYRAAGKTAGRGQAGVREFEEAFAVSKPVDTVTLMYSKEKPRNTSAVRWRMELCRRANPWRFAAACP